MPPSLRRISKIIFTSLLLLAAFRTAAQEATPHAIRLNGHLARMRPDAAAWIDSFRHAAKEPALTVIQLKAIPDDATKQRLAEAGIILHSFLSPTAAIASVAINVSANVTGVAAIAPVDAAMKVSPVLEENVKAPQSIDVIISCVPSIAIADVSARIVAAGGTMLSTPLEAHAFFEASIPGNRLELLAKWPSVLSIGLAAKDAPLNLESQRAAKVNVLHASAANGGYGLLGDSITVGVGDISCGLYHVDTRDRVVNYNFLPYHTHGQHVSGTVGGAGILDPYGEGFAPHVKIVNHYFNHVWERTGAMLSAHNMTVTNNSYAATGAPNAAVYCAYAGTYDAYAQALDSIALQYPSVLHVFAAGNDGGTSCLPYPTGYATIAGGYQAAKNIMVVANSRKFFVLNGGSSRGPVRDGRLRPDIAAAGSVVYSCRGGDGYQNSNGTSMSSPQVAGAAALLQQHYKRLNGGAYPSAVLTRALLMNGAQDLGNTGPDYAFGYGFIDLKRSLGMLDSGRYTTGSIGNAANQTPVNIAVPANTAQLKVMLVWHDRPASPLAAAQLVNDLDLKVTSPSSTVTLPYVLNPTPASVTDPATKGADHLNNIEQVVIDNPAAGSYAAGVSGYAVPAGPQAYTVVYDIIPRGITLTSPFKGDAYKAGVLLEFYWTASDDTAAFTIEYSTNNGGLWTTLSSSVAATDRRYTWSVPAGINSGQCFVRITRNGTGQQSITGAFAINDQPVLSLLPTQCPGYVNMKWTSVGNATGYSVLRKVGYYLEPVATTTDTFYYASGLRPDSIYYFSVQPLFGTARGFRSIGVSRRPDTGSCTGSYSDNDLMADKILLPGSGRLNTSTALTSNETLSVQVRNLDDAAASSYKVSYQINGGTWQSQTLSSLPAASTTTVNFTGLNLATPGTYIIRAAIQNLSATDPVSVNDTISKTFRQLPNSALTLNATGVTEDFESLPAMTLLADSIGFAGSAAARWDFYNSNDTGRLRTFVDSEITISGQRSISMDMQYQESRPPFNQLTGTFNLSGYSASSDELRLEFDYKLHGRPKTPDSNKVWVRGSDTQPWKQLMAYSRAAMPGTLIHSGSLSITDSLNAASQSFSSSFQIAFGQYDTSAIATNHDGNGLTLDNVRLYRVSKDVGLSAVTSPAAVNCALSAATPLSVTVFNGTATTATSIGMNYQLDGGTVVNETLTSLAGKTSQTYTFSQTMNASGFGPHTVKVWTSLSGDDAPVNDTLYYSFRNEPLVAGFPYLQDFESNDGYWWTDGTRTSWAWGTPASTAIKNAASGTKAWKTNLTGYYNDGESSYLYSPCFDISGLTTPYLSFSVNMQIEDCGSTLCDGAWVEYSIAGGAWTKLGMAGQGTNWYNSSSFQLWNTQTGVRWRAASIPLPAASGTLRLRFAFSSDPGGGFEGIAVDDIHVYDRTAPLYAGGNAGPVTQTVATGGGFTSFTAGSALLAQISAGSGASLGNTDVTIWSHAANSANALQYYLPKNFVVNTQNTPTDSITARLFVSDADVLTLVNATGCTACSKPEDAYRLGVTKYDNPNTSLEDSTLTNNSGGTYVYIPYSRVRWVPYDAGYYAQFRVASFSELWFNDGGPGALFPLPIVALDFDARRSGPSSVLLTWSSLTDTQVASYELQRSGNASDWDAIATVPSAHDVSRRYSYTDAPPVTGRVLYYRIKYILRSGVMYFSPVRQIILNGGAADVQVYPNPTRDGALTIDWSTEPGAVLEATVTDVMGRKVAELSATASSYSNRSIIDLGAAARGIYFLHAMVDGERFDVKVVRE